MILDIKHLDLNEEKAKEIFSKSYEVFKNVINNKKGIEDYGIHFDWETVEDVHQKNMSTDTEESDFYFTYNGELYSLDISHKIEDFGYNSVYFYDKYRDIYKDLYCCAIYNYRKYFEYGDLKTEIIFLYDKRHKRIVEILEIVRHGLEIDNKKFIREVRYDKVLKRLTKSFN